MRLFEVEFRMRCDATAIRPMQGDAKTVTVKIEIDDVGMSAVEIERIASPYAMDQAASSEAYGGGIAGGRVIEIIGSESAERPADAIAVPEQPGTYVWSVQ